MSKGVATSTLSYVSVCCCVLYTVLFLWGSDALATGNMPSSCCLHVASALKHGGSSQWWWKGRNMTVCAANNGIHIPGHGIEFQNRTKWSLLVALTDRGVILLWLLPLAWSSLLLNYHPMSNNGPCPESEPMPHSVLSRGYCYEHSRVFLR